SLGCTPAGAVVHTFLLLPPLAVVLVPPQRFLDGGVEDVVWTAFDELRVIIEQETDGLLQPKLASKNCRCFLNDGHGVFSFTVRSPKLSVPGGKIGGTGNGAQGGSDPKNFLGG